MTQLIAFDISAYKEAVKKMILQKMGCPQPTIEAWDEIMEEQLNPNAHVVECNGEMWFPYLLIGGENVLDCISIGDLQAYLLEQYALATFALPDTEIVGDPD